MDLWNGTLPPGVIENKLVEIMSDIMKTSLSEHEEVVDPAPAGRPLGGHTLKKHAGKSDAELLGRFGWDSNCHSSSGFFNGVSFAEAVVAKALLSNLDRVYTWYTGDKSATADLPDAVENDKDLHIVYQNNFDVGRTFKRSKPGQPARVKNKVSILLRWIDEGEPPINGRTDFILTAYPC
ncbi:RNase A-like domain-containing protein [Pantoea cypripedii]|uniref:Bacterial CdiA-CT RNAse A domain-containing protein n=1 Tax=Pantoea cypripedii TaxID=55209 RepID=A0A6B9GCC8_PANCY|nr:RNase A-like domain-containing protein [Pantoea cypripedii]QGY33050.1 hypothetical protein CUN67_29435 [Pantoea cypripedii]